jgi:hypothetical protein
MCLVWSAALMTPIAGTPRIDCLCADGHVRLFCLSVFSPPTACCTGHTNTQDSPGSPTRGAGCCGHGRHPGKAPADVPSAGTGCKKTLAEAKVQSVPPAKVVVQDPTDAQAPALAPVAAPAALPGNRPCLLSWHSHGPPPPTDLVIVLQHFVI